MNVAATIAGKRMILPILKITGIVAGALIACAAVYGNIDARMDKYEIQQAVEKGVNQEKWKSLEKTLEQIGDDIKELKPNK